MPGGLDAQQISNARAIYRAAIKHGRAAAAAALLCARAECSYLRTANNGRTARADVLTWYLARGINLVRYMARTTAVPHDAVEGEKWTTADSIGFYQQRPMYGYCPLDRPELLMDVDFSTDVFLTGGGRPVRYFLGHPKLPPGLDLAAHVQWVQGSEFPDGGNYRQYVPLVNELVAMFETETTKDEEDGMAVDLNDVQNVAHAAADSVPRRNWDEILVRDGFGASARDWLITASMSAQRVADRAGWQLSGWRDEETGAMFILNTGTLSIAHMPTSEWTWFAEAYNLVPRWTNLNARAYDLLIGTVFRGFLDPEPPQPEDAEYSAGERAILGILRDRIDPDTRAFLNAIAAQKAALRAAKGQ